MNEYVLIESRDPFESNDVAYYYDLARGLALAQGDLPRVPENATRLATTSRARS
jgi:hypothetical protein